jgi:hypothetical protein
MVLILYLRDLLKQIFMFKYYFCPVDIGEEELSSVEFEGENVLCIKDDMLRKRIMKQCKKYICE